MVSLNAVWIERDALRYTPAGVPMVSGKLQHQSAQTEAGQPRETGFEITAVAAAEQADAALAIPLNQACRVTGFLNRKSRNSRTLVLHITHIELLGESELKTEQMTKQKLEGN
ncbi:MAG: primosomal replication protein N [Burkholderiaceae bacterium]|nr:MAG: primosomal replication protein N [Burkholderiaceae bacterium]